MFPPLLILLAAVLVLACKKNVVLGGTSTVIFNSLGQPSAAATYTLTTGSSTIIVSVAALTGFVTVSL